MSRPFTLPVVIACSAHALLMFGFKKPEVVRDNKTVCVDPGIIHTFPVPLEEPDVVTPAAGEKMAGEKPAAPPPPSPEAPPSTVILDEITMDRTRSNPHVPVTTHIIPVGPYEPGENRESIGGPGDGGDGIIFNLVGLDKTPRMRVQNSPAYPLSLKVSGISGEVLVEFIVDERGHVTHPRVLRSTHPDFESATLNAVSKWRFEPGTRKMKPVSFKMVVPVKFNLND